MCCNFLEKMATNFSLNIGWQIPTRNCFTEPISIAWEGWPVSRCRCHGKARGFPISGREKEGGLVKTIHCSQWKNGTYPSCFIRYVKCMLGMRSNPQSYGDYRSVTITGWWQLKYFFMFIPKIGEDEPILTSIFFQMGWFNHQPDKDPL